MKEIKRHPTHKRNSRIVTVALLVPVVIAVVTAAHTAAETSLASAWAAAILLIFSMVGFGIWIIYTRKFLRCPACRHYLVLMERESWRATAKFHCPGCDVIWDTGMRHDD